MHHPPQIDYALPCLPKQRIVDLVVLLVIKKMVTSPAHTKHVCFVSHIIIMQGSAQVNSSDYNKINDEAKEVRKRRGERERK